MDFARKQLEKYGWKSGKGLGKQENGIIEAIKPKLKRSVAGIGHDAASEFTEHWWKTLYDKASQNVEIQEENGVPKRFKAKEEFEITNSTWKLGRKNKFQRSDNPEYFDNFVKKAILTSGGTKLEAMSSESENEEDLKEKKDVSKMTDEELFAACGGRTAHKGARHGLKATGKLARIEQQELTLLTSSKFAGYSQKKTKTKNKNPQMEELSLSSDSETKHKKKKKKYCNKSINNDTDLVLNANELDSNSETSKLNKASTSNPQKSILDSSKTKKFKRTHINEVTVSDCNEIIVRENSSDIDNSNYDNETAVESQSQKKKRHRKDAKEEISSLKSDELKTVIEESVQPVEFHKKKKRQHNDLFNSNSNAFGDNALVETAKIKKKKRKSILNEVVNDL